MHERRKHERRARPSWHKAARPDGSPCSCHIHSDPKLTELYTNMSRSPADLMRTLLPCGRTAHEAQQIPGEKRPFLSYNGCCAKGMCGAPRPSGPQPGELFSRNCGWQSIFGADCPVEADAAKDMDWQVWMPQQRGLPHETNEGKMKTSYSPELVPAHGTRAAFFTMLRLAAEEWMPHEWRDRTGRRGLKVHEFFKTATTATRWCDYAAAFETRRLHTKTCSVRERHNFEVSIMGFSPYDHEIHLRKWGKRPAHTVKIRKQKV